MCVCDLYAWVVQCQGGPGKLGMCDLCQYMVYGKLGPFKLLHTKHI